MAINDKITENQQQRINTIHNMYGEKKKIYIDPNSPEGQAMKQRAEAYLADIEAKRGSTPQ